MMITSEILRTIPLFAAVPEHERETIAAHAADITLRAGDWVIHEGETPSFFGLISGRLSVLKVVDKGDEREITTFEAPTYFGEVPLLLGSPAVASIRAIDDVRLMRLDGADFRRLILSCSKLSEEVVRTMAHRISDLQGVALTPPVPPVTIVGHRFDLECHDLRDFLTRNGIVYDWLDCEDADAPLSAAEAAGPYPLVILTDGSRLVAPALRTLAERLGLHTAPAAEGAYDVVVIGAGPAGLAAAVYGASEGLRTLVVEREAPGGQAGTSSRIENYLGFANGISGDELSSRAWHQAKRFGAEILVAREVTAIEAGSDGRDHTVVLDGGERICTHAVVVCSGVTWRRLDVDGIDDLVGCGVYYGASRTEALGTRGKHVYLVGGGNSAGQAAMFFSNYAASVTLLIRGSSLAKSMSQYLIDQLATKANVDVQPRSAVRAVRGNGRLEAIVVEDVASGEQRTYETGELFIFIGADAETGVLPPEVLRDAQRYVCTGRDVLDIPGAAERWPLERDPYILETSVPGIFAAGDVRHGSIKRVASGVGEGSMTVAFIHRYLEELAGRREERTAVAP
jgi:thioredoxin reductase (NADPH)